jgi:hypothetical protein
MSLQPVIELLRLDAKHRRKLDLLQIPRRSFDQALKRFRGSVVQIWRFREKQRYVEILFENCYGLQRRGYYQRLKNGTHGRRDCLGREYKDQAGSERIIQ